MSEIRYKDFKNKVDVTKPYNEQNVSITGKFSESEFNDFKNRVVAEAIAGQDTLGAGAASAVDLAQDSPEVRELIERIADETKIPGSFGKADDETVDFIKRVQEGKKKGDGISGIFESLPPELKKDFELFDVSKVDKLVEVPGTVNRFGFPLTADMAGGMFNVPSVSDLIREQKAREAEQDLEEIGKGADFIGYTEQEKADIAAGRKKPRLGELIDFGLDSISTPLRQVPLPRPGAGMGVNPVLLQGPNLPSAAFEGIPAALRAVDTSNLSALNADLNNDGVVDELDQQIAMSTLPAQDAVPGVTSRPMKKQGLMDLLSNILPGVSFLRRAFPNQVIGRTDPFMPGGFTQAGNPIGGVIRGGIYSAPNISGIGRTRTPANLANDFFDPKTGKTRFDRALDRFKETGSMLDLFAASRSGSEFRRLKKQAESGIIGRDVLPGKTPARVFSAPGKDTQGQSPRGSQTTARSTGGFGQADFSGGPI